MTTPRRHPVPVVRTPYQEVVRRTRAELAHHDVDLETFLADGAAGRIDDPELRALWLRVGPVLHPDGPHSHE